MPTCAWYMNEPGTGVRNSYRNSLPGAIGRCVIPGTPSMALGGASPCQCTVVPSGSPFSTCTRSRSPARSRISGPGTVPYPQVRAPVPARSRVIGAGRRRSGGSRDAAGAPHPVTRASPAAADPARKPRAGQRRPRTAHSTSNSASIPSATCGGPLPSVSCVVPSGTKQAAP